jgi:multiple sugar transport system ATP-binding protein
MATVELQNISKCYVDTVKTVSDVNVSIRDGEFIVLVGPSGCGKSTLLRMVAGLEHISSGNLLIDGKRVNDVPAKDRDIAMVFQNYALYPHMNVYDNMAFGLKMRKFPKKEIDKRVREAAEILDLTRYLERKPKALSGGQRQRVAVGRAIVRQPKIFLFDEPLSNLDAKLRVAMRAELVKLHKRLGATMIYVTHDQIEAMSMGDRLIVLNNGLVQQVGAPLELYNRPANQFVASFIGSPPMNFLRMDVEEQGSSLYLVNNGVRISVPEAQRPALRNGELKASVVLGIRPEDLFERSSYGGAVNGNLIETHVEYLETMGSEVLATCAFGPGALVARLSPRAEVKSDDNLELVIDLDHAKLFDSTTGEALRP